ncbi:MAG: T9SS type A sorting domain-containing protein, partial [Saprospiraceae bacterium]|nr:T9SS type A sorting domain-containing protein [Saprospiraceae bacterium]
KSRSTAQLDRSLAITTNYADPKIVGVESGTRNLALGFDDVDLEESLILFQNSPNPFAERTMIGVYITEEGQGNLQIRDASGRAVWSHSQHYQKGYHEHEISADQLGMSGLLFYSFRQGDKEITKKMMQVR